MFVSSGIKRYIAAVLVTVAGICRAIPATAMYADLLEQAAAVIGGVGVAHAATKGTVKAFKLSSLTSVLAVIIAVAPSIPQLAPFIPLLNLVAMLLGAGTVAKGLGK